MPPYFADPENAARPTESEMLEGAAAEIRALKGYVRDTLVGPITELTQQAEAVIAEAQEAADDAVAAAITAAAAANYIGEWSSLTGAAAIGVSVSHAGKRWLLKQALADITTVTPGTDFTYWQEIQTTSEQIAHGSGTVADALFAVEQFSRLLNCEFDVAQQGVSFGNANGYTLDQWALTRAGGAELTVAQSTDVGVGSQTSYSLRATVTTADAAMAAGDYGLLWQRIEGYNVRDLMGVDCVLTFSVRSAKAGVHTVSLRNHDFTRSYLLTYTVNVPNTWEFKSLRIPGGISLIGTWNMQNGVGVDIGWCLAAGTSHHNAATDAWLAGSYIATPAQVNVLETVGNIFAIADPWFGPARYAGRKARKTYIQRLEDCRRYWRTNTSKAAAVSSATTGTMPIGEDMAGMRTQVPAITLLAGTNKLVDPSVANRNVLTIAAAAPPEYIDFTTSGATPRTHIVLGGTFAYNARL